MICGVGTKSEGHGDAVGMALRDGGSARGPGEPRDGWRGGWHTEAGRHAGRGGRCRGQAGQHCCWGVCGCEDWFEGHSGW